MDIKGLFANKFIQNAAFGALKKGMAANGIKMITVIFDPQKTETEGEDGFSFGAYKEMPFIVNAEDGERYKTAMAEYMKQFEQPPVRVITDNKKTKHGKRK